MVGTGGRLGLLHLRGLFVCQSLKEARSGRLVVKRGRLHPRVRSDLLDSRAQVTVIAEEFEDQVLEVGAERRAVDL